MKLLEALRNSAKRLKSDIEDSNLIMHSAEKGRFREFAINKMLRPHIPKAFGIGTGFVFDQHDSSSDQMDIVIYDNIFGNILFEDGSSSLFPCECVFGAIECKSNLNSSELEKSIKNAVSLKKLNREKATACNITPVYELKLGAGLKSPEMKLNHYFHGVVALDSIESDKIIESLNKRIGTTNLPDFIWVYNKGYFILPVKIKGTTYIPCTIGEKPNCFISHNTEDDTFPLMLLTLNTLLGSIRLKAPDYNRYWINVFDETLKK